MVADLEIILLNFQLSMFCSRFLASGTREGPSSFVRVTWYDVVLGRIDVSMPVRAGPARDLRRQTEREISTAYETYEVP